MKYTSAYDTFINTWTGRRLLASHSLKEEGFWDVWGESTNPDLGGCHSLPFLAKIEGSLEDVIRVAVSLPNFWTWGGGGEIKFSVPPLKANTLLLHAEHTEIARHQKWEADMKKYGF